MKETTTAAGFALPSQPRGATKSKLKDALEQADGKQDLSRPPSAREDIGANTAQVKDLATPFACMIAGGAHCTLHPGPALAVRSGVRNF